MTELPTVTVMNRADPFDRRAKTDGAVAPGVEVRVVDDEPRSLTTGCEGELLVRGPERMLGYVDPEANRAALDDAGWFRTGDIGVVDGAGASPSRGGSRMSSIVVARSFRLAISRTFWLPIRRCVKPP